MSSHGNEKIDDFIFKGIQDIRKIRTNICHDENSRWLPSEDLLAGAMDLF